MKRYRLKKNIDSPDGFCPKGTVGEYNNDVHSFNYTNNESSFTVSDNWARIHGRRWLEEVEEPKDIEKGERTIDDLVQDIKERFGKFLIDGNMNWWPNLRAAIGKIEALSYRYGQLIQKSYQEKQSSHTYTAPAKQEGKERITVKVLPSHGQLPNDRIVIAPSNPIPEEKFPAIKAAIEHELNDDWSEDFRYSKQQLDEEIEKAEYKAFWGGREIKLVGKTSRTTWIHPKFKDWKQSLSSSPAERKEGMAAGATYKRENGEWVEIEKPLTDAMKEWQVECFTSNGLNYWRQNNGTYNNRPFDRIAESHFFDHPEVYTIWQVRRLSDNLVFSVGEEVNGYEVRGKIRSFVNNAPDGQMWVCIDCHAGGYNLMAICKSPSKK